MSKKLLLLLLLLLVWKDTLHSAPPNRTPRQKKVPQEATFRSKIPHNLIVLASSARNSGNASGALAPSAHHHPPWASKHTQNQNQLRKWEIVHHIHRENSWLRSKFGSRKRMNSAKGTNFRPKTRGSDREHRISGVFATSLREKERERKWGNLLSLCYPQRRASDGRQKWRIWTKKWIFERQTDACGLQCDVLDEEIKHFVVCTEWC
jgi:hypothetical protein